LRQFCGCGYPNRLLTCRTCDVPASPVRLLKPMVKRQALIVVTALVAVSVVAGGALGDPRIDAKRAQAQQVLGQIDKLDASLERARSAYEASTQKLNTIDHSLSVNKVGLRAARSNLKASQAALMQRLRLIYVSRDDQSTLGVMLGAKSITDLVTRIEAVQSVSSQDLAVMNQVVKFKRQVTQHQHALVRARRQQAALVARRAAAKSRISSELGRQQNLLSSIKGQISQLIAADRARALASAAAARTEYEQAQQAAALQTQDTAVGATASTPDGTVAPPSQYGGVVGIAMRYLGVPYVWGGSSPSGFDCSGFVMYVYAQVGVSLPHYTGAQWNVGVPVARGDLQPGDLVFFDGLGHVGIYIGGGQFVHAPHTGDVVKISNLSDGWYAATYVGARRIL
jgi:cell wall-associated NlpC family hydrolase